MTGRQALLLGTLLVTAFLFWRGTAAVGVGNPIVRIAELEIDPAQLDGYKLVLKEEEEIETSIRVEPGVLTMYAVSLKGHSEQIRLFETYRDAAAYDSHIQSPHFETYKERTRQNGEISQASRNLAYPHKLTSRTART